MQFVAPFTAANVSKDKRIAFVTVQYAVPVDKITQQSKDALEAAAAPAAKAGLEVEYSGGVISTTTQEGNNDLYGIIIAFFVLTITFGALVSAGPAAADGNPRRRRRPAGHERPVRRHLASARPLRRWP